MTLEKVEVILTVYMRPVCEHIVPIRISDLSVKIWGQRQQYGGKKGSNLDLKLVCALAADPHHVPHSKQYHTPTTSQFGISMKKKHKK